MLSDNGDFTGISTICHFSAVLYSCASLKDSGVKYLEFHLLGPAHSLQCLQQWPSEEHKYIWCAPSCQLSYVLGLVGFAHLIIPSGIPPSSTCPVSH